MKHSPGFSWLFVILCVLPATVHGGTTADSINRSITTAGAEWTAADTPVSQMPLEECIRMLGHDFAPGTGIDALTEFPTSGTGIGSMAAPPGETLRYPAMSPGRAVAAPASFDWRNYNGNQWMTPVKNQGQCGSCTAFASCGALEVIYRQASHNPGLDVDLSEQHLFTCAGGHCAGVTGISFETALSLILYQGIPDEACFPYQGIDLDCAASCTDWQARAITISGFQRVSPQNDYTPDLLKPAVMIQPLLCSMLVYDDFRYYSAGVYQHVSGEYLGGHAVVITGWDDTESCWICKNSWGTDWGEDGYFRIRWEDCSIGGESTFIFYNLPFPAPTLALDLVIPDNVLKPGDICSCTLSVNHTEYYALGRCPLLVALEVYGHFFFAPSFNASLDYYKMVFPHGTTTVSVLPQFAWPSGAGSGSATFYAGALDPTMTQLISNLEILDFSWE